MNLVKAELTRIASRRFVQVMLVLLVASFGVTIFTVIASSSRPTEIAWTQARHEADSQRAYLTREYASCRTAVTDKSRCEDLNPNRVATEDYLYGVFHFGRKIEGLLYFLGAFLSLFGFLVMASYLGSELHSGGMTNLLLWRPNRMTVLGTKLGVGLGFIGAISAVFTVIYVATFYGIASVAGWAGGLSSADWSDIALISVRGLAMALIVSTVAFAIATVGRHTAAALGALLGYVIVWEGGARLVAEIVRQGRGGTDPYFLSTYVAAWFSGHYDYHFYSYEYTADFGRHTIYWWQSGIVFGAIVAAVLAVAFATFRRRDIA